MDSEIGGVDEDIVYVDYYIFVEHVTEDFVHEILKDGRWVGEPIQMVSPWQCYSGVKNELSLLSATLLSCVPHITEQSTFCSHKMPPSTNLCLCNCMCVCLWTELLSDDYATVFVAHMLTLSGLNLFFLLSGCKYLCFSLHWVSLSLLVLTHIQLHNTAFSIFKPFTVMCPVGPTLHWLI